VGGLADESRTHQRDPQRRRSSSIVFHAITRVRRRASGPRVVCRT